MRQRLVKNCKLVRAQAALVALLYVFLCTLGTLTHTHASEEAASGNFSVRPSGAATAQTPPASPQIRKTGSKHTLSAAVHCAFCDWQINNQGRTVVPFLLSVPQTTACSYVRFAVPAAPVLPTRSSSRAPPIV